MSTSETAGKAPARSELSPNGQGVGADPAGVASPGEDPSPRKRRRRRRRLLAGSLVVILAGAGAYGAVLLQDDGKTATADTAPGMSVAEVERTDLVQTASFDGTLSYADSRSVVAAAKGTVTALPKDDATIKQGQALYAVDAVSTYLFYGSMPMYRTLSSGVSDGVDVEQLETALEELGFDPDGMTVDEGWTSATTAAVDAWKESVGLPENGRVSPQEVQFTPEPLRVESVSAFVGQNVSMGSGLWTATSTSREVTVPLKTTDAGIAKVDDPVTVRLPDGVSAKGTVTDIGSTATAGSTSGTQSSGGATNSTEASDATSEATVDVTIALDEKADVGSLDTAPVTVEFTQKRAEDVLAVPVTALLAVTGGGFAVEVDDGAGRSHLVGVKPGLYSASGLVEVEGEGLTEGTRVLVPASS